MYDWSIFRETDKQHIWVSTQLKKQFTQLKLKEQVLIVIRRRKSRYANKFSCIGTAFSGPGPKNLGYLPNWLESLSVSLIVWIYNYCVMNSLFKLTYLSGSSNLIVAALWNTIWVSFSKRALSESLIPRPSRQMSPWIGINLSLKSGWSFFTLSNIWNTETSNMES